MQGDSHAGDMQVDLHACHALSMYGTFTLQGICILQVESHNENYSLFVINTQSELYNMKD